MDTRRRDRGALVALGLALLTVAGVCLITTYDLSRISADAVIAFATVVGTILLIMTLRASLGANKIAVENNRNQLRGYLYMDSSEAIFDRIDDDGRHNYVVWITLKNGGMSPVHLSRLATYDILQIDNADASGRGSLGAKPSVDIGPGSVYVIEMGSLSPEGAGKYNTNIVKETSILSITTGVRYTYTNNIGDKVVEEIWNRTENVPAGIGQKHLRMFHRGPPSRRAWDLTEFYED